MSQLTIERAKYFYPKTSKRIWFLIHCYNEEDCLARCLDSVKNIAYKIVVLVDDRTIDKTEEIAKSFGAIVEPFTWNHSFSEAKNLCISTAVKHGMQEGDWMLNMGSDFVLKRIDLEFVKDPCNFIGRFLVPEYHPSPIARMLLNISLKTGVFTVFNPNFLAKIIPKKWQIVSRCRTLLNRYNAQIDWQNLVDEEISYCAYRVIGLGCIAGNGISYYKMPPTIGEMLHYGFYEDGSEEGKIFTRKKAYYNVLRVLQFIASKTGINLKTTEGRVKVLNLVYNNPDWGAEVGWYDGVNILLDRVLSGDYPEGLKFFSDKLTLLMRVDHE